MKTVMNLNKNKTLKNFIYIKNKSTFEEILSKKEISDEAVVFIEDVKEIWTHGTYFCNVDDGEICIFSDKDFSDDFNNDFTN